MIDGRSPYGERGLKSVAHANTILSPSRSPYGERGLKCFDAVIDTSGYESLSLRRAWIEIIEVESFQVEKAVALLTESVD